MTQKETTKGGIVLNWYKNVFTYILIVSIIFTPVSLTYANEGIDSLNDGLKEKLEVKRVLVPYQIERRVDAHLAPGTVKVLQAGSNGWKERVFKITYKDDHLVKREVIEETFIQEPINKIILVGEKKTEALTERKNVLKTSRGTFRYRKVINMNASAYSPSSKWGNRTASGIPAKYGVVAVDPKVIPLGTRLYVEGYGPALAADTGGAIKGHKIDLFYESYFQAMFFGRKKLDVYILE